MKFILRKTLCLILLQFSAFLLFASNRYWIASSTSNWNNTANWSTSSGGSGGASVPGSSDAAYFDASGVGNCNMDATVYVYSMNIAGYTGTITQTGSNTIRVGNGWTQSSGTFAGGTSLIDFNNDLNLSGGTFTSTSGSFNIDGSWYTYSGGTFNHNNGTVNFDGSYNYDIDVNATETFYNLYTYQGNTTTTVASSDVLVVLGTLTLNGANMNYASTPGYFDVRGNLVINQYHLGGNLPIKFTGTATTQTVTLYSAGQFNGNMTINKSSGSVKLLSNLTLDNGNQMMYLTSGTLDLNGYTLTVSLGGSGNTVTVDGDFTVTGAGAFNARYFNQSAGTLSNSGSANLRVYVDLTTSGGTFNWGSGTVDINNDFILSGGTFNAPSSTLYLDGDWTHTAGGTFNHNNGLVILDGSVNDNMNVMASETFYNLNLSSNTTVTVASADTLIVAGTLTMNGGAVNYSSTPGNIDARGNVVIGQNYLGGNMPLKFSGSAGTQTFNLYNASLFNATLTIDKSAGTVQLTSNLTLDQGNQIMYLTSGTLDLNGYTLTVSLGGSGNTVTVNGDFTVTGSGAFNARYFNQSAGTLTNSGSANLRVYVDLTTSGGTFNWGSGTVDINNDFILSGGTFNAPASILYLDGDWTHTAGGTFNHNSGLVQLDGSANDNIDVMSIETFYDLNLLSNTTITVASSDTLIVTGTLTLNGGSINYSTTPGGFGAQGNVVVGEYHAGGNLPLHFTGTANQTFSLYSAGKFTANVRVDKSAGEVDLISAYTVLSARTLTIYRGIFHLNNYTLTITGSCSVESNGILQLQGNETISGTPTFQSGSTVCYVGRNIAENLTIKDYGATDYCNLRIDDDNTNQATYVLGANLTLSGTLYLTDGTISAGTYTLTHNGITGTDGTFTADLGTVNAPSGQDLGNLGLVLTSSSNLGNTTIEVAFSPITANSNTGIYRFYRITPTNNTGLNATIVFNYQDSELNGITESNLILFESTDGSTWTNMSSSLNTSTNELTVNNVDNLDWLTAGSSASPLPVSLVQFNAHREHDDVVLTWTTASEENNSFFAIERGLNGIHFDEIQQVNGQGNSTRIVNYQATDYNVGNQTLYYRLRQNDYDGEISFSKTIVVQNFSGASHSDVTWQMGNNQLSFSLNSGNDGIVLLNCYKMNGQMVLDQSIPLRRGNNQFTISTGELPTGIYNVCISDGITSSWYKIAIRN